jgi:transposase
MMMTGAAAETVGGGAGATRAYVCPARDQLFLLPVSMRDWLDAGHLAFYVIDVIALIDTSALHRRPGGCAGRPPYQPEMMCALLLYSYCCGIRSSRRIEEHCRTDAAFKLICGGLVPDHATISRFVVDHEQALEGLFVEGVRLCAGEGLCDLSVVALDGTKIAADASLDKNRDAGWIRQEIAKLIAVTREDEQPVSDGLPGIEPCAEISTPAGRRQRLEAALAVIEAQDTAAAAEAARHAHAAVVQAEQGRQVMGRKPKNDPLTMLARAEIDQRVARERVDHAHAARAAKLAALAPGQTYRGRPFPCRIRGLEEALQRAQTRLAAAREAVQTAPPTATRANITDPHSRIMKTRKGWIQGFNAQTIANTNHIALAVDVSQNANDIELFAPMNDKLTHTLTAAGITEQIGLALADAGYDSDANLTCPGPDRLIAIAKAHKQRAAIREHGYTDGPPPPNATAREEMEHLLRTPQGAAAYKQRSGTIEPVFGNHKHNRGFRIFRRRGLPAAQSEWAFENFAGNILKLYQHHATPATA